jgi:zinc protease
VASTHPVSLRHHPKAPSAALVALLFVAAVWGATTTRAQNFPGSPDGLQVRDQLRRASATLEVPVEYFTLDNGLKVVLSLDRTTPVAVVAVYYHVGFRNEPKARTGFAHLFEHLMFQGSQHLGKMQFIRLVQSNGGVLNGSTRFDFTNYFEIVPVHALETVLWAEADRMRALEITAENLKNQQAVVINEVKVNVLNQPYGGFPWLDLPQKANENWYNAHNFYGELADLESAALGDVRQFFDSYYAPNNAVLAVVGDIDVGRTKTWVQKYFGGIPSARVPPRPGIAEPRQEREKRFVETYPRAPRPGLALGYHAPPRTADEYFALGLLDQILAQGKSSRLYQALVQDKGLTDDMSATLNGLGNMFNIEGPTLYTISLFHDRSTDPDTVLAAIDREIARLQAEPIDRAALQLARTKMRSALYDALEGFFGFGRADLLASLALFFDDPRRINTIEERFGAVTPELIQKTAKEYLRTTNRTVLIAQPGEKR